MIMTLFAALLGSRPLQWALAALIAMGGYEGWKYHQRHIGAAQVEAKIEQQTEKEVAKATEARGRADVPDAVKRLRQRSGLE